MASWAGEEFGVKTTNKMYIVEFYNNKLAYKIAVAWVL